MQADYALDIRECFITHWVYADFDVIRNYNRELQIMVMGTEWSTA
jgi:hypothetical protein